MEHISETILKEYQVRKTKAQKLRFIELMKSQYPNMKVEEGGIIKSRNLVIGDVDTAEVVFTAHYDTCAVLPVPNFITPKNFPLTILYGVMISIPFFLVMLLVEVLLMRLTDNFFLSFYPACLIMFGLLLWVFMLGKPNEHTANDNTSGVILLCELMAALGEVEQKKAAFVFFDNEENGLFGSAQFLKKHKKVMKSKFLINFDCVSDGDHMLLVANKAARERYGEALTRAFQSRGDKEVHLEKSSNTFYPSDQMSFPINVGIAALKKKKFIGYYMNRIHTKHDVIFEEENICILRDGGKRLIEELLK